MARETKVGLLAGLAFIVCFAIILTNNGQRDPLPASSRVTDGSRREAPARTSRPTEQQARQHRPRLVPPSTSGPASGNRSTVPFGSSMAQDPSDNRPANPEWRRPVPVAEYDAALAQTPRTAAATGVESIRSPSTSLSSRPPQAEDAGARAIPATAMPNEGARPGSGYGVADAPGSAQPANASSAAPQTDHAPRGSQTMPAPTRRRAVLANYTVAPGDTLTHIAAKHYGQGSRRFINAIVDANRSTVADPDKLRAGMQLVIPSMDAPAVTPSGGRQGAGVVAADQPTTGSMPRPGRPAQYRWYQIKKSDRYISIAREELGDASRWEEIYELNKEKFPDAGMIREGVRIKLPVDQSASAERRP